MNDGDFIKVEYEMRAGDDKKLVMTSSEKLAKDNDIFDENRHYGDVTIIVGSDQVFKKINDSFTSAEKDKEYEVDMTPEEAYGVRDPKNIKIHTYREFKKQNVDPVPGMEVHINNKHGKVLSVTPGRVLVDYNAPLAGRRIQYKYTIKEKLDSDESKVASLVSMNYPVEESKVQVSVSEKSASIKVPEEAKFDPVWIEAKFRFVNDVRKYLPGMTVILSEEYEPTPEPVAAPENEPASEKQAEDAKPAELESAKVQEQDKPEQVEQEKANAAPDESQA